MSNQNQLFRDGTSQNKRFHKALDPDYVSVDERTDEDLLRLTQQYSQELDFYNLNNELQGKWKEFFDGDPKEIIGFLENPETYKDDEKKMAKFSRPHLVLYFTFLKLLNYPQQQFRELTRRHLDFYYKEVLKIKETRGVPDKVHILFNLTKGVESYFLKKGTQLNAGKDSKGTNLCYETDNDIELNKADVADVRAIYIKKNEITLREMHLAGEMHKKNYGFKVIMQHALGDPENGDPLPKGPGGEEGSIENLEILYNDIIKKKPDQIDGKYRNYILKQLCFRTVDDFKFCMKIHLQRKGSFIELPLTCKEWNVVYDKITDAYKKKTDKNRRGKLKVVYHEALKAHNTGNNRDKAFEKMMRYALGEPKPGDRLPRMPKSYNSLQGLYEGIDNKTVIKYIRDKLLMSKNDFKAIMFIKNNIPESDEIKWDELYRLVVKAQIKKRKLTYQTLSIMAVDDIYASTINGRFKTFSQIPEKNTAPATMGLAITSPILFLRHGTRTITITLFCKKTTLNRRLLSEIYNSENSPFDIKLSSDETWITNIKPVVTPTKDKIKITLNLKDTDPPILPSSSQSNDYDINSDYPIIKISLKKVKLTNKTITIGQLYEELKRTEIKKVNLNVNVEDVKELKLRNDNSLLDVKKPFEPFGHSPISGSSFYITNNEISGKKLKSLDIKIEWMGIGIGTETDLAGRYKAYCDKFTPPLNIANNSFKSLLKILVNATNVSIGNEKNLFTSPQDASLQNPITFQYTKDDFDNIVGYDFDLSMFRSNENDPLKNSSYFRFELSRDFLHQLYPIALNRAKNNETVYQPYTPTIKDISIGYSSEVEIGLSIERQTTPHNLCILQPFGFSEIEINKDPKTEELSFFMFPQYDDEGYLYIGLKELNPPQKVSFLFQHVAGTGNPGLKNPDIKWKYLTNNRIQKFEAKNKLLDTTNSLLDAGIVTLQIPEDISACTTMMPRGKNWISVSVATNPTAIPDTLDIKTRAVVATFKDQHNAPDHLDKPLLANTIKSLTKREPAIKEVKQPYSSFGGKVKEQGDTYYTRVSERLRHKNRALTTWDYEHIVLERFPRIFSVKCLNQVELNSIENKHKDTYQRGEVMIIVVPDISNTEPFFPLEPGTPLYLLKEIEDYLKVHTTPFTKITVVNPRYERIRYRLGVRFNQGSEEGYHLNKLNKEIIEFLSPWAYKKNAAISFGGTINNSVLVNFVKSRDYVDYVANLKLAQQVLVDRAGREITMSIEDKKTAKVHYPDTILVSASEHLIDVITTREYEREAFEGIGYMRIGIEFGVG